MNRRTFVKGAATGVAAATGIEGILAARQAPAYAQGAKLHITRWTDFVPAGDEVLNKQMEIGRASCRERVYVLV